MPIVDAGELLSRAGRGGYAVGYFEAWDMQSIEAVITAAEQERSPVIIGFGSSREATLNQYSSTK